MTQSSTTIVTFDVRGTPGAKGSPHHRVGKNGHVIVQETASVKSWERLVRETIAIDVFGGSTPSVPTFVDVPLAVHIVFRLVRPGNHWGKGKNAGKLSPTAPTSPAKKPDIDKLARSTLDSLTGIVFDDDSRIVWLGVAKVYAAPGREGARIIVKEWRAA